MFVKALKCNIFLHFIIWTYCHYGFNDVVYIYIEKIIMLLTINLLNSVLCSCVEIRWFLLMMTAKVTRKYKVLILGILVCNTYDI